LTKAGLGAGVVDRLKEQRFKIRGVNFGNKAKNQIMWGNKRAEMWGAMRDWLRTGHIPSDRFLKTDLISPRTKPDSKGTLFLESKKDMKARGLASPDAADAIAVTFAFPVASVDSRQASVDRRRTSTLFWCRNFYKLDGVVSGSQKKSVSLSVGRGEKLPVSKGAGLTAAGRAKYNAATGSKLKAPAPNPKTKADAGRKKSFCARMGAVASQG